jgi:NAD(P)-dependent dehydrogenase (short-subunit alcohol dehydrogenase family)
MEEMRGNTAVVTGAGGNLGYALTNRLLQSGARVVVVEHRRERLEEIFGPAESQPNLYYLQANLTEWAEVQRLAEEAIAWAGRIHLLANIAGGFKMGEKVYETELETWGFMLNLNAKTVLLTSKAFVPHMIAQGGGKIINVGARAALQGGAQMGSYVVSKAAVIRLTETLAAEVKQHNINVNCVLPGTIDTPQNRQAMPNADVSKWVTPEQLADVMLFLASPQADAIHGAAIPVYGKG